MEHASRVVTVFDAVVWRACLVFCLFVAFCLWPFVCGLLFVLPYYLCAALLLVWRLITCLNSRLLQLAFAVLRTSFGLFNNF